MGSKILKTVKEYIILTAATLLMAAGIYIFKFPNNFTFGGVTGFALIISELSGFGAGVISSVINMALLIIGFFFLGKSFGVKTVYVSVLLSALLYLPERIIPITSPLTDQPVLELIFAIVMPAISSAILFNMGASSGGTDIIAMILKKYTPVNIGTALLIVDIIAVAASFFVFGTVTGLYSLCGLFFKSFVIDTAIENINLCKYFTIISRNPEPICDYIHKTLKRGATKVTAVGTYSGVTEYMILTVIRRSEAVQLRNFIKQNDPEAFMMITNSSEIIGKGFREVI